MIDDEEMVELVLLDWRRIEMTVGMINDTKIAEEMRGVKWPNSTMAAYIYTTSHAPALSSPCTL